VARVVEVAADTGVHWLVEVAGHAAAVSRQFLPDARVTPGQLDGLVARLSAGNAGEVSATEAIPRLAHAPHWGWGAIDPGRQVWLAIDVGDRPPVMARCAVPPGAPALAPDGVPRCLTEGFKESPRALLTHYGHGVQPPRRQAPGPVPKPRWMALPQLLYAQVVNRSRRRRVAQRNHRLVSGTWAAVRLVLAASGWQVNTAFIARANLALRQHAAAGGRRVMTLGTYEAGLRQQRAVSQVYDNLCLPPASLRQPLPQPVPTHGSGSAKRWRPCTPATAAGRTDHVWRSREVLPCRVPPWPQPPAR
jgi:hypothetical protein